MPQRVQMFQVADFTGGLNYRDDAFALRPNETPECLNVRLLPQGGFTRRKTMSALNTSAFTDARNVFSFLGNSVTQVIVQDGNVLKYSTGTSTFTSSGTAAPFDLTVNGIMRAATMARVATANSERLYVQRNAEQVAFKWSGTAGTAMGNAHSNYNDTISAPAGGFMPKAKYIVAHLGFMFHAYTVEAATQNSRVRWSHPGQPEDYRTDDYTDVGADDGDVITGLASFGHVLYIFKTRSVWTITGYDPDTFQLAKVFDGVGSVSQEAVAISPSGLFFFDGIRGMFAVDHKGNLQWLWDKLANRLIDSTIPSTYVVNATAAWMDSRLWLAVPYGSGQTANRAVFVWDPLLGKEGGWYRYDYGNGRASGQSDGVTIGPMLEWHPTATTRVCFAIGAAKTRLERLEYDTGSYDVATSANWPFSTMYRSAWFNAGTPALRKRWRRASFVVDADVASTITVSMFANYSSLSARRTQGLNVSPETAGGGVWGTGLWGTMKWGPAPEGEQEIIRGTGFGNAYAVQLQFDGPQQTNWGLNSIDFRYIPQRVR